MELTKKQEDLWKRLFMMAMTVLLVVSSLFSNIGGAFLVEAAEGDKTPGGVVSNNLSLWMKADDATEANGQVTAWTDKSGKNDFTVTKDQKDGGEEGKLTREEAGINFNPAVVFDGYSHLLGNNEIDVKEVFTVAMWNGEKGGPNGQTSGGLILSRDKIVEGGGPQYYFWDFSDNSNRIYTGVGGNYKAYSYNIIENAGEYSLWNAAQGIYRKDGITGPDSGSPGFTGIPQIGKRVEYASPDPSNEMGNLNGNIAELVVLGEKASDDDRAKVSSYLSLKYGLTLTAPDGKATDYVASDGTTKMWTADNKYFTFTDGTDPINYAHRITGIGRDDASGLNQKQSKSEEDASVTIALGNTIAATNAANGNTFANDISFFTFSDNGKDEQLSVEWAFDGKELLFSERVYIVEKTNFTDTDITIAADEIDGAYPEYMLISKNHQDAEPKLHKLTDGKVTIDSSDFVDGGLFQFASEAPKTILDNTPGGTATNPVLWLKANDGMTSDASGLTGWTDKAEVNEFTLDVPKNKDKPTITGNGVNFNPTVGFDNPSALAHYDSSAKLVGNKKISFTSGFAVYKDLNGALVGSVETINYGANILGGYSKGNLAVGTGQNNKYRLVQYDNHEKANIVNYQIDNEKEHKSRINGQNKAPNRPEEAYDFTFGEITPVIGATQGSANNWNGLFGDVAEVILYDKATVDDAAKIESYLAIKYGITLNNGASDYVASNDTKIWTVENNTGFDFNNVEGTIDYKHRITGIGRDDASGLNQKQSKSEEEDASVTIALGNTIAATNAANGNTFANDISFFTFSDNGKDEQLSVEWAFDGKELLFSERVYIVEKTNFADTDITIAADEIDGAYPEYMLISKNHQDAEPKLHKLTDGKVTIDSSDFVDGGLFQFASVVPQVMGVEFEENDITVKFDKEVELTDGTGFSVKVGESEVTLGNDAVKVDEDNPTKVIITLPENTDVEGQDITVSYNGEGNLKGTNNVLVGKFEEDKVGDVKLIVTAPTGELDTTGKPEFKGKATPGAEVTVKVSDDVELTATADENGDWSVTPEKVLDDGDYEVEITAEKGGKISEPVIKNITVDTNQYVDYTSEDEIDGIEPEGVTYDKDAGKFKVPANIEEFTFKDGDKDMTATKEEDGKWTFTAKEEPEAPRVEITKPADGNVTTSKPEVSGTATPGAEITVKITDDVTLTTTADDAGNWSVTPEEALAEGPYVIEVTAEKDGVTSERVTKAIIIETEEAPTDPEVDKSALEEKRDDIVGEEFEEDNYTPETWSDLQEALDNADKVLGNPDATQAEVDEALEDLGKAREALTEKQATPPSVEVDEEEYDETPTFTGKSNAKEVTIELKDETGKVIETVTVPVNEDGTWSFTPTNPLLSGYYTLAVSATIDSQTVTDEVGVTIAAKPTATVTKPAENTVTTSKPEIAGTATPGAKITVKINDDITLTTTADADGNWSVTPEQDLPEGTNTIVVTAEKEGKTSNPVQKTITVEKEEEPTEPTVDKSLLKNYYNSVKGLEEEAYTPETWADFATALNNAKTTLDNPNATQDDVNNALNELIANHQKLTEDEPTEDVDKKALQNMHNLLVGKKLDKDNYTPDSWNKYEAALNNAKAVLQNPATTQDEVDEALRHLVDAYEGLEEQEALVIDKSKLMERNDEIRNENFNSDDYTTDSWKALDAALNNAAKVLENLNATQEEVDYALVALNKAYDGLADKPVAPAVDKSKLEALDKDITKQDLSKDAYTADSWKAFREAQKHAEEVLADENATQAEVDAALAALNAAYKGLAEKKETPKVDKSKLEAVNKKVTKEDLSKDAYTSASWKTFSEAQQHAEKVLADKNATQADVNAALKALEEAYKALEKKAQKPQGKPEPTPEKPGKPETVETPPTVEQQPKVEPTGEKLPGTATPIYNQMLFGLIVLLTGLLFAFVYSRKTNN